MKPFKGISEVSSDESGELSWTRLAKDARPIVPSPATSSERTQGEEGTSEITYYDPR